MSVSSDAAQNDCVIISRRRERQALCVQAKMLLAGRNRRSFHRRAFCDNLLPDMATADFVLESPNSNTTLLVEAKNTEAPSREWAARFGGNLLEHFGLRAGQYFLLVLRNKLYLWKHLPTPGAEMPDFEASTEEILQPYLVRLHSSLSEISPASFELLVRAWLSDLSDGAVSPSVEAWVRASGLSDFQNATIREESPN